MGNPTCSVPNCTNKINTRRLCSKHYARWRKYGSVKLPPEQPRPSHCRIPICQNKVGTKTRGFCTRHYKRRRKILAEECSVNGCRTAVEARGVCVKHYNRLQRGLEINGRFLGEIKDGKKICPNCKIDKPLGDFTNSQGNDIIRCWPCHRGYLAEYRAKNPQPSQVETWPKECDCGKIFAANKKRYRYCSSECKATFKNKNNWKYMNRRRAKLRAAYVETFDRFEIFERDNWICQLCDEPIDKTLKFPDRHSATVDHITPISRGGKHERSNAQAAHNFCNSSKRRSHSCIATHRRSSERQKSQGIS